jgi:hypothetical protein
MANNYSRFSDVIHALNLEEQRWVREELQRFDERPTSRHDTEEECEAHTAMFAKERNIEADTVDCWPSFEWQLEAETDDKGTRDLWLYADESFDLDHILAFVQRFLQRFRPEDIFAMTWAETCSRPRIGEFGGGWMVVGANDYDRGHTWGYADEAATRMKEEIECQKKRKQRNSA